MHPIDYLSQKDSKLGLIIKSIGEYSIEKHSNPFESLLHSIISQQLSGKSANAIYKRFLNYYGGTISTTTTEEIISTPPEILRTEIGLSFRKIEYIKNLSLRISDKRLNLYLLPEMSDEGIVTELVKVKGIGRWTAEMFLIFCLGREDVIPTGDLGIRKAIKILYNLPQLPTPSSILNISLQWKPYRSIATWYLWKSLATFDSIG